MALARAPVVIVALRGGGALEQKATSFLFVVAGFAHLLVAAALVVQGILLKGKKDSALAVTAYVRALSNLLISATLALGHVVLR